MSLPTAKTFPFISSLAHTVVSHRIQIAALCRHLRTLLPDHLEKDYHQAGHAGRELLPESEDPVSRDATVNSQVTLNVIKSRWKGLSTRRGPLGLPERARVARCGFSSHSQ